MYVNFREKKIFLCEITRKVQTIFSNTFHTKFQLMLSMYLRLVFYYKYIVL